MLAITLAHKRKSNDLQRTLCSTISGTNNMEKSSQDFQPAWKRTEDGAPSPLPVVVVAVKSTRDAFETYLTSVSESPPTSLSSFLSSELAGEPGKEKFRRVCKAYKITDQERETSSLEDAVLCRIATKDVVR